MAEPYCLAMLLCDAIHQDLATGKHTLLGTFSTVTAAEFPAHIHLCVYFAITDGLGKIPLKLRIVDAETDIAGNAESAAWESPELEVNFPDPLMVCESTVSNIPVILPKAGVYFCELYSGTTLLMSRRLLALGPGEVEKNE
jgi:hypothetical protein